MRDDRLSQVGKKIKEIRKNRQMSLQEVAVKSEVTAGLLSKIENFRTIPSLPVLLNVAKALDVNISELVSSVMHHKNNSHIIIRNGEGAIEEREDSKGLHYRSLLSHDLTGGDINLRVNIVTIDIDADRDPIATDAMELIHVLSGSVLYGLPSEQIELYPGDTLFFDGRLAHSVKNNGEEKAFLFKIYLLQSK